MEFRSATATDVLLSGFLKSSSKHPNRPAVDIAGSVTTYQQLHDRAATLGSTIQYHDAGGSELVGVFAYRSALAYEAVLGTLMSARAYVPLNPTFPVDRTRAMLVRAGCTLILVDEFSERQLSELLVGVERPLTILLPHRDNTSLGARWPQHRFLCKGNLRSSAEDSVPEARPRSPAYVLFTSGSTGTPKAVVVSRSNVRAFIQAAMRRYQLCETDRLSQYFDMTFDLSAFDMFMAWEAGACICCLSQRELISPGAFIKRAGLTTWFSVPSAATFMHRLGALRPGQYPALRWSLFCGEALPLESAERWQQAAPNSVVENLYGPTELTIACTAYRFDPSRTPAESEHGLVPIGTPLEGMEILVVDEMLREVAPGDAGELVGRGPQLSSGYLNDAAKTATSFVHLPGRRGLYYRTGDLVQRPAGGLLKYLGRIDDQLKVNGFRVEPGEIEAVIRQEAGVATAVAVGWPRTPSGAGGIVAFLESAEVDLENLDKKVRGRLPEYMAPRQYRVMPELARNGNGKIDRKALLRQLEGETCPR